MAQAIFHFPRGFLWGTATSSHQVEGNNINNTWHAWEQQPGRIHNGDRSGLACDWWGGRWKEDLDRAAGAGQNAHRLSIEWSRIQPAPDRWDEDALDHYREILRGLRERDMTPLVTLHHFSDPVWLAENGGWEDKSIIEKFTRYAQKVTDAFKEYNNLWVTINEPNLFAIFGHVLGLWPPGKSDISGALGVVENILRAHASAYHAIHSIQPQARVGLAHHYIDLCPRRSWSPLDRWATNIQYEGLNDLFRHVLDTGVLKLSVIRRRIPEAKGTHDFFGLNYYTRSFVSFNLKKAGELFGERSYAPGAELSEGGWLANEPQGFYQAIKWAMASKIPIMVTENGVNDAEDQLRPRYLIQHLHQLWRAVNFNYPVKGYFHWTLTDNFEWERGWSQRFGLWALDPQTQARTRRPSASLYAEICQENGISSETVARYAPQLLPVIFPD